MSSLLLIIFGLIILLSGPCLGYSLIRSLPLRLSRVELAAMGLVVGLLLETWLTFIVSLALPYNWSLPVALLVMVSATAMLWRSKPRLQVNKSGLTNRQAWLWAGSSLFLAGGFIILARSHFIVPVAGGYNSAGSTWADFGMHMELISHFAAQSKLHLDAPYYEGAKLTYPFLTDFLSSVLVRLHWAYDLAITIPALALVMAFFTLIVSYGRRIGIGLAASLAGLSLFLLDGSAGGWLAAYRDWQAGNGGFWHFLAHLPSDYTTLNNPNLQFSNVISDILLPQRAFLFGFAIVAAVLILLHRTADETKRETATRRILAAVLIGLLPLTHPHSFIAAVILFGCTGLVAVWQDRAALRSWIGALAVALVIAAPQIAWQQLANGNGSGGHLALGWAAASGQSVWAFWWTNFGLIGLWFVALPILIWRLGDYRRWLVPYLASLALMIIANIYALQPFAYDNVKLITYAVLILSLAAGQLLVSLLRRSRALIALVVVIFIICTASGFLSVLREFQLHDQFASGADVAMAQWISRNTAPSAVIMGDNRPNNPAATLAGRPLVMAYNGWVYSYNLPYAQRMADIQSVFNGHDTPAIKAAYHADYLTVSRISNWSYTADTTALASRYRLVYQNTDWSVFALKP